MNFEKTMFLEILGLLDEITIEASDLIQDSKEVLKIVKETEEAASPARPSPKKRGRPRKITEQMEPSIMNENNFNKCVEPWVEQPPMRKCAKECGFAAIVFPEPDPLNLNPEPPSFMVPMEEHRCHGSIDAMEYGNDTKFETTLVEGRAFFWISRVLKGAKESAESANVIGARAFSISPSLVLFLSPNPIAHLSCKQVSFRGGRIRDSPPPVIIFCFVFFFCLCFLCFSVVESHQLFWGTTTGMTDFMYQPSSPGGHSDSFRLGLRDGCRSPIGRYTSVEERPGGLGLCDLKHSKSDDLMLQSAPINPPEIQHGISEASLQIQREACVVYEDDLAPTSLPVYFSDSETMKSSVMDKPPIKITGDFGSDVPSRRSSQYIHDRIDPEDSIKDIISENDFYRFVLFKRHYEKYLDISKKYEEARNIAYYLEEKYHEIKAERDSLECANLELEKLLETKEALVDQKEDELFLQLEKAIRLEEDCEKLKVEREKISEWKDRLEKEKNEAYRQLKLQADESEATRRRLERARNDVVRQVTAIVAEKDGLEKENARLKDALRDIEGGSGKRYLRNMAGLEKEVSELKMVAKQSATLNSQLKKGMKHLATCRRRKCSVCSYTRATFGDYHHTRSGKLLSCFNGGLVDKRLKSYQNDEEAGSSRSTPGTPDLSLRLSHLSLSSPTGMRVNMSYIDDNSSDSDEGEACYAPTVVSNTSSTAPHAFSSDSGFSSEICDPSLTPTKSFSRSKWTSSFRKLIRRVSKRQLSNTS